MESFFSWRVESLSVEGCSRCQWKDGVVVSGRMELLLSGSMESFFSWWVESLFSGRVESLVNWIVKPLFSWWTLYTAQFMSTTSLLHPWVGPEQKLHLHFYLCSFFFHSTLFLRSISIVNRLKMQYWIGVYFFLKNLCPTLLKIIFKKFDLLNWGK